MTIFAWLMIDNVDGSLFSRTELLVGEKIMERISCAKVILFGVGGVGSWCAEGLARSGIRNLTIVDSDRISVSNVNRQLMATTRTIGQVKVDALRERLLDINPGADIIAVQDIYCAETADKFDLGSYDYVIDAIDSLKDKSYLILRASESEATFFSSMGAALKIDPTKVKVAEFWDVRGCPLGAAIRKKFKRNKTLPAKKFLCVYGDEVLPNLGVPPAPDVMEEGGPGREDLATHDWTMKKAVTNGATAPVTAIFGLTLAGLVLKDIYGSGK